MAPIQPIHPDDYVSDITVDIGLALRDLVAQRYPGRIRERLRDSPLTTVPGHTVFVPSSESLVPTPESPSTTDAARRILPAIVRDVDRQLSDARIEETSNEWSLALTWDGHGLYDGHRFVGEGFRFDAYAALIPAPVSEPVRPFDDLEPADAVARIDG